MFRLFLSIYRQNCKFHICILYLRRMAKRRCVVLKCIFLSTATSFCFFATLMGWISIIWFQDRRPLGKLLSPQLWSFSCSPTLQLENWLYSAFPVLMIRAAGLCVTTVYLLTLRGLLRRCGNKSYIGD